MFGYVTINKRELKVKDFETYQAYYCGLCHTLQCRYGRAAKLLLTYDMTFLGMLLTSLYGEKTEYEKKRCVMHPARPVACCQNPAMEYAADMNLLLAYQNLLDDWKDDRDFRKLFFAAVLKKKYAAVKKKYPRQVRALAVYLKKLDACERRKSRDLDEAAGLTGEMLKEIFIWKEDVWKEPLGRMGFYLGKFFYLMDAYEDLEHDKKAGTYNPLLGLEEEKGFDDICQYILNLMMADCSRAFEYLPVIRYKEILRNILYSGVWIRFVENRRKRAEKLGENDVL